MTSVCLFSLAFHFRLNIEGYYQRTSLLGVISFVVQIFQSIFVFSVWHSDISINTYWTASLHRCCCHGKIFKKSSPLYFLYLGLPVHPVSMFFLCFHQLQAYAGGCCKRQQLTPDQVPNLLGLIGSVIAYLMGGQQDMLYQGTAVYETVSTCQKHLHKSLPFPKDLAQKLVFE